MRQCSQLPDSIDTYNADSNHLATSLATILQNHPELASVVESWSKLSEPVRAGILAMVRAVAGSEG